MPISFSSVWLTRVRRWTDSSSSSSSCASGTFSVRCEATEIRHPARIVDALHDHRQLGLDRLAEAGELVDVAAHRAQERLDAQRAGRRLVLAAIEPHAVAGALADELLDARPAEPLHQHLQPPLGELAHPHDHADGAGAVEALRRRLVVAGVALRDQEDETLVGLQRLGHRLHRHRPRHPQRNDHVREDDQVPDGQQREHVGDHRIGRATTLMRRHATTISRTSAVG